MSNPLLSAAYNYHYWQWSPQALPPRYPLLSYLIPSSPPSTISSGHLKEVKLPVKRHAVRPGVFTLQVNTIIFSISIRYVSHNFCVIKVHETEERIKFRTIRIIHTNPNFPNNTVERPVCSCETKSAKVFQEIGSIRFKRCCREMFWFLNYFRK